MERRIWSMFEGKKGPCWRCHAYHSARTNDYHSPIPPWLDPITQIIPESFWGLLEATVSSVSSPFQSITLLRGMQWIQQPLRSDTIQEMLVVSPSGPSRWTQETDTLQRHSPIDEILELHTRINISTSRLQSMMHRTGSWPSERGYR